MLRESEFQRNVEFKAKGLKLWGYIWGLGSMFERRKLLNVFLDKKGRKILGVDCEQCSVAGLQSAFNVENCPTVTTTEAAYGRGPWQQGSVASLPLLSGRRKTRREMYVRTLRK